MVAPTETRATNAPRPTPTAEDPAAPRPGLSRALALMLAASGLLFLLGAIIHPHAPQARTMAEVAYVQTGEAAWWPAHVLLLSSYVVFAAFLVGLSRRGISPAARRVVRAAAPVACFCVLAMLLHLILPVGRDSVADSHSGWALWAKDFAETADGVWALCIAAVAWRLGRTGTAGNGFTAVLGLVGGIGFAVFSFFVPLTGVVVSMQFTRALLQVVPVTGLLIAGWAVVTGVSAMTGAARRSAVAALAR